ncbi:hypothetical protein [Nonomuraea typhae]|uniref:hypothetical protein n=1 Tax=Nonomuraea typhae TaxID=2603600 RepID=UPI001CA530AB|nr:hypothetical protein [Nonomuraea typhae]
MCPSNSQPDHFPRFLSVSDWSCFAKGALDQLPSLTPAAQALLDGFRQHADERGLDEQVRRIAARSMRMKSGVLPDEAVHWLKTNFLKTELELGHCLRLPAEGPCECDLYLTCAKFVTTPEYAPRLRVRMQVEQELVQDANQRGWAREAERHTSIARRLQGLLTDLGETADPVDDSLQGGSACTSTD